MSKKIVVTGAFAHVGRYIVDTLSQEEQVRIIALDTIKPNKHKDLTPSRRVEWIKVDSFAVDPRIEDMLRDADEVYHCSGATAFDEKNIRQMYESNTLATKTIVNYCLKFGVRKLAYLSTADILQNYSFIKGYLIKEEAQEPPPTAGYYIKSKFWAELEVQRAMREGLRAVIVSPTCILHPKDKTYSMLNALGVLFRKNVYPTGAYGFIDIRDAANIMIRLMNSSIENDSFILNAENKSYRYLFEEISLREKRKRTLTPIRSGKGIFSALSSPLLRPFPRKLLQFLEEERRYDNTKLKLRLKKFNYTPLQQTLDFVFPSAL